MNQSVAGPAYVLRFSEPWTHMVDVVMTLPVAEPEEPLTVWMPVWTPGSYLVREYSRHVERLSAEDESGSPLNWKKTQKNRWMIEPGSSKSVVVRYRVYGREMSVRTNWIEDGYAFLCGAATFLTAAGFENRPHRVRLEIPASWSGVWTGLEPETGADETGHAFVARDLDELVDCPILAGTPAVYPFSVDDVPFELVNVEEGGLWDGERAATDARAIVEAYRDMYGSLPFDRYVFLNLITEARGGLEHKNSCVMMTSRYACRLRKSYLGWLSLLSHEFFHVWNVKRSRPAALGPFDYENETYSRTLWVAEGITAYYTDLVPHRAGLSTEAEYLGALSNTIALLQNTPGRKLQSVEDSSFDAWIKLYRRDENTGNTSISYYTKGAVVAWLLDVEIRRNTDGERCLDDLMRLLYRDFAGDRGFTDEDVQTAAETIHGSSLALFFDRYVRGVDELEYTPALKYLGLRFRPADADVPESTPSIWLGIETRSSEGKLLIERVLRDGPAWAAGLNAEDEIIAVGGYRVTPATFAERLHQYSPGDRIDIFIARRDAVRIVPVEPAPHPGLPWRLEPDPEAGADAVATRKRWLQSS